MNKAFVEMLDALAYESPLTIADALRQLESRK